METERTAITIQQFNALYTAMYTRVGEHYITHCLTAPGYEDCAICSSEDSLLAAMLDFFLPMLEEDECS